MDLCEGAWLMLYLPFKTLSQDWVVRAVEITARTIGNNFHKFLKEVSSLTHAVHALKVYKDKLGNN